MPPKLSLKNMKHIVAQLPFVTVCNGVTHVVYIKVAAGDDGCGRTHAGSEIGSQRSQFSSLSLLSKGEKADAAGPAKRRLWLFNRFS